MIHSTSPCTLSQSYKHSVKTSSVALSHVIIGGPAKGCRGYKALTQGVSKSRGTLRNRPSVVVLAAQDRPLSINQRWRSLKTVVHEQNKRTRQAISSLPPVRLIGQAFHMLQQKLEPLYKVLRLIQKWWSMQLDRYTEFGGDEVKRQWEWKRRTEAERRMWEGIVLFSKVSFLTVAWMTITPVSIFWGAFLPLHAAWSVYDRPLLSPVFITFIPMMLMKFPPGYPVRLF